MCERTKKKCKQREAEKTQRKRSDIKVQKTKKENGETEANNQTGRRTQQRGRQRETPKE